MYYACLRTKKEQKSQNGEEIIRKAFVNRDDARKYISQMQLAFPNRFDQAWTE
jgi:hypothetical protein